MSTMLEQELKEKFPGVFIEKNDFGPVLSHHPGRGLLALSWIEKSGASSTGRI